MNFLTRMNMYIKYILCTVYIIQTSSSIRSDMSNNSHQNFRSVLVYFNLVDFAQAQFELHSTKQNKKKQEHMKDKENGNFFSMKNE